LVQWGSSMSPRPCESEPESESESESAFIKNRVSYRKIIARVRSGNSSRSRIRASIHPVQILVQSNPIPIQSAIASHRLSTDGRTERPRRMQG
jgi:hypothetical protein